MMMMIYRNCMNLSKESANVNAIHQNKNLNKMMAIMRERKMAKRSIKEKKKD